MYTRSTEVPGAVKYAINQCFIRKGGMVKDKWLTTSFFAFFLWRVLVYKGINRSQCIYNYILLTPAHQSHWFCWICPKYSSSKVMISGTECSCYVCIRKVFTTRRYQPRFYVYLSYSTWPTEELSPERGGNWYRFVGFGPLCHLD